MLADCSSRPRGPDGLDLCNESLNDEDTCTIGTSLELMLMVWDGRATASVSWAGRGIPVDAAFKAGCQE